MIECLNNGYLLTNFSKYLSNKQILYLSMSNSKIYNFLLNPIFNPKINSIYRDLAYNKFYYNELCYEKEETEKTEDIFDNYKTTKNNWKVIYNDLILNMNSYSNKEIVDLIYNCFKNHLYLPGIRENNKYLEFKFSTLHQLHFYDSFKNNIITYNYYNKFTKENGFYFQEKNDFILHKSLFFENEFLHFNDHLLIIEKNNNLINILERIMSYDYENLDLIYTKEHKNQISDINSNEIIKFVLYLNHTIISFAKLIKSYIIIYNNNDDKLLLEYLNKYNDFINFSLLINDHFKNINIMMNYLNKFILTKNNNDKRFNYFSIYKMCLNIIKNEIYEKLEKNLKSNFKKICEKYFKDLINNSNKEKEINENNESKTKEDSDCIEDYEEIEDYELNENREISDKEKIENFMNSITDLNINEFNANLINHSQIIMNEDYERYENIIINTIINTIDKYFEEGKSFSDLFLIILKTFSIQNDDINNITKENRNNFNIINKTNKKIFQKIIFHLKNYIIKEIKNEFIKFIERYKNKDISKTLQNKRISLNKKNIINKDKEYLLTQEKKIIFLNIYLKEKKEIQKELIKIIINKNYLPNNNEENFIEIINDFFNNIYNFEVNLKEIFYYYFIEMEFYSKLDKNIINLLIFSELNLKEKTIPYLNK